MKYQEYIQQNIEEVGSAPKALKQRTFKKIEQINLCIELFGFYSSMPNILLHQSDDESTKH